MAWQHTTYAYPVLFATALSLVLGTYTAVRIRHRGRSSTLLAFAAMTVAIAVWTAFAGLKLLSTDPAFKFQSYRLLHVGSAAVGPLLLLFVLAYTDRNRWLTRRVVPGLFAVPAVFVVLLFLNPNDVAIVDTRLVEVDDLVVLRTERGPASVVLSFTYAALMAVLTLGVVFVETLRTGRSYYPQAALVSLAVVAPMAASVLTIAGVPPFGSEAVNLVPSAAGLSVAALGVATFRYRLLDLPPIAYTTAMERSPDGIVVLDAEDAVVRTNDSARRLLGLAGSPVGRPAAAVLPTDGIDLGEERTIETTTGGSSRVLAVRSQPLRSQESVVGRVVVLRDVTSQKRYERSLELRNEQGELLNRLVRHDIRNEMDVVLGLVRRLEPEMRRLRTTDPEAADRFADSTDRIRRNCEHVVDLTETVGEILRTIERRERDPAPVELRPVLGDEIAVMSAAFEEAVVEIDGEIPDVTVRADEMLSSLFYNLLSNAVVHADRPTPRVTVSTAVADDRVAVTIADNGPGLPEATRDLLAGESDPREHAANGYGLYIVRTLADGYGADLSVTDNRPTGTRITIGLDRVERESDDRSERHRRRADEPAVPS